jgi:hypothetical protein
MAPIRDSDPEAAAPSFDRPTGLASEICVSSVITENGALL